MCLLNLMAWKASCAHRTGENEKKKRKKDNDKIESRSKRRAPVIISSSVWVAEWPPFGK